MVRRDDSGAPVVMGILEESEVEVKPRADRNASGPRAQDYFCFQAPLPVSYHQPRGALSTQRRAKVLRISASHSG